MDKELITPILEGYYKIIVQQVTEGNPNKAVEYIDKCLKPFILCTGEKSIMDPGKVSTPLAYDTVVSTESDSLDDEVPGMSDADIQARKAQRLAKLKKASDEHKLAMSTD